MPEQKPKTCFVIGPIGEVGTATRKRADFLLKGIIKQVLETNELGYKVLRADEIPTPGMIDSQVINAVLDADLVVADLSEHNPNAFYELALRHMEERPIIHMIDRAYPIPFDVKPFRTIVFAVDDIDELEKAKVELHRQATEVQTGEHEPDNPVTKARGYKKLRASATSEQKVLLDRVEGLSARLASLEQTVTLEGYRRAGPSTSELEKILWEGPERKISGLYLQLGNVRLHPPQEPKPGKSEPKKPEPKKLDPKKLDPKK